MLLAIVIVRLFPELIIRRTYAKTLSNSHLSISSAISVAVFPLPVRKLGMSTMRLLGNIFPKL